MPTSERADWDLVDFAKQVADAHSSAATASGFKNASLTEQIPSAVAPPKAGVERPETPPPSGQPEHPEPAALELAPASQRKKQLATPDQLARLILDTLWAMDSCPDRGLVVTVYGSNPWNAMLMIRPEAGCAIDRTLWITRVQDIGVKLRNDFYLI